VKTNFAVAAGIVVIGLLPVALIGLFVKTQYDRIAAAAQMARMVKVAPHPGVKGGTGFRASVPGESRPQPSMPARVQVQKKIEDTRSKTKVETKATETPSPHAGADTDAIYNRACFIGSQGNFQEAENLYTQAIALNNKDADAYYNRGLVRMQTHQYDLSVKDFTRALELDPKFYEAYCNRGNAHYRAGRSDLAINDYGMALQLKPDDGDLYFNRGIVLLAMGREQEGMKDIKEAARMGQQNAATYLHSPKP
jgi:tetratricopeptide (TPR) repeat protein